MNNFSEVSIELVDEVREELICEKGNGKPGAGKPHLDCVRSPAEEGDEVSNAVGTEVGGIKGESKNLDIDYTLSILDDIEANLKKILEHGKRADGIVKSMLLHSRGKSGERIPTDLNKLARRICEAGLTRHAGGRQVV